jgi:hypothetical protein
MRKRRLGKDEKREVTPEFVNMGKEILYPQIQGVTLMGILSWDNNPMANPPRAEFPRRENPDGHEVEKFGLRDDGHVVTCERQLAVGVDWRNHHSGRTQGFPLGRHLDSTGEQSRRQIAERIRKQESKN